MRCANWNRRFSYLLKEIEVSVSPDIQPGNVTAVTIDGVGTCCVRWSMGGRPGRIWYFLTKTSSLIGRGTAMCRNIKTLFNFEPPVTENEVQAASLQFVRKITGFNKPSKPNEAAFQAAVDEIAEISLRLMRSLETNAPPKNREEEAAKAKARAAARFGD